jgi:outer membrane protein assembly factor BamD
MTGENHYKKTVFIFVVVAMFTLSGCGWWNSTRERDDRAKATPESLYQSEYDADQDSYYKKAIGGIQRWWKYTWGRHDRTKDTPESLYQSGYEAYQDGYYKKAIERFQRLRDQQPLSKLALLAELGIADSHFSDGEYGEAQMAYNDFINLHPTNENIPYAMYQLGMCHYRQMYSIDQDQTETLKARKEFEKLIARFPNSKFSIMAEKVLRECKQRLGDHEFYIGQFYFKRKQYTAALKRFETIERDYANLGLDYKVNYLIGETKKRLAEKEAKKERNTTK